MIKLLTTLLIAVLSATAKAEPVVYYCEVVKSTTIDADFVDDGGYLNGLRFKMAVDFSKSEIRASGDFGFDVIGDAATNHVTPKAPDGFSAHSLESDGLSRTLHLTGSLLAYGVLSEDEDDGSPYILNIFAHCDKF